jgi:type II secretory pathway component GspD/PulD (secretin)
LIHPSSNAETFGLAAPTTTNANGMRAWILGATESRALQQRLKTNSAASLLGSPGIATFNGFPARVVVGSAAPTVGVPGTGVTIDLIPKVVSGSVKLTVSAASIEVAGPSRNAPSVKTNFAAACQAVIPNGGSLVLDGGPPPDGGDNRYWLIVSPRVWIPTGK